MNFRKGILLLAAFSLAFCLFAADDDKDDDKDVKVEGGYGIIHHLVGIGSLKFNADGTVTLSETKQTSLKENAEFDLKSSKGGKKHSVVLKPGEKCEVSNKWREFTYKFEKIEGSYALFSVHYKKTKYCNQEPGLERDYGRKLEAY